MKFSGAKRDILIHHPFKEVVVACKMMFCVWKTDVERFRVSSIRGVKRELNSNNVGETKRHKRMLLHDADDL